MSLVDPPGPYCARRLFEWTMALALTAFGLHILLLPHTMQYSRYSGVLLILTVSHFAIICIVVGAVRTVALSQNGGWPTWGPRIRAFCALASAAVWGQLAVSLLQFQSPGSWVYVALAGAELRSVWRARRDANGPRFQ